MLGPVGMFGTVPWKHVKTVQRGNLTQAVFAGLSMGPFARGNLAESGVKKWLFAKNVKSLSLSQTSGESLWQAGGKVG